MADYADANDHVATMPPVRTERVTARIVSVQKGEPRGEPQGEVVCHWTMDDNPNDSYWHTDCNHAYEFTNLYGPTENGFMYCPYCGRELIGVSR